MIEKIEMWDFECHKHSVLENFDKGLNLIFGDSDSGKTSIVRALKLVAYNEFDPLCVRTGAKNCKVRVTTGRGWVEVERGTKNVWTTCRKGDTPQVFEKIGKSILPEAAEILGLHMVELGDMKLPVNIMDQNEGHFMLNELGGDNASGSMRAQIVDEISGLSGIEGLIKEVSLDRHRFGRAMKESEDHAKKLRESMHDKPMLDAEEKLLDAVKVLVERDKNNRASIEVMADLFEEHHNLTEVIKRVQCEIDSMPHTKSLQSMLKAADEVFQEANQLRAVHKAYVSACKDVETLEAQIDAIQDTTEAKKAIVASEEAIQKAAAALAQAEELSNAIEDMERVEKQLQRIEEELMDAMKEKSEALADIDVCPLSDRPISPSCIENIKFPVTSV